MSWSHEFPLDTGLTYLNHAAVAPWPARTARAVANFAEENQTYGATHYPRWLAVEAQLRQRLAQLLNASSSDDIALLKNTSEGLSLVAYGLPWDVGDSVVGIHNDFPSNRVVWESLDSQGVVFRGVDVNASRNPEDDLIAACDRSTRLMAVSSVHYASGLRLDLQRLGQFCRDRKILFCIDAIQSLGAIALDVEATNADFVAADGHKWLLGPEGTAVFYCRPAVRERLKLWQYGWHMLDVIGDFTRTEWQPSATATRFECGSSNMLGIHALNASLSLLEEAGQVNITRELFTITDYLLERLDSHPDIEVVSPIIQERRSGIVSFYHRKMASDALYRTLMQRNVICANRDGLVRFSPHFYTSPRDIDRAINKIPT